MKALISVSDKTGVVEFAKKLVELGWEILSTSGTMKMLSEAGIPVISVSDITGFPEICDGRVKTLHPKIHGALLARRDLKAHLDQLKENRIDPIDLVCVNLYPFKETIAKPDVTMEDAVEHIDIGGPSMLRSAAKNWKSVTVLVNPQDYPTVIKELETSGETTLQTRLELSAKAYTHTAEYDMAISTYMRKQAGLPEKLFLEFDEPFVVGLKHANPCGSAIGKTAFNAWQKAYEADKVSIFGGIVAFNREVDFKTAELMKPIFLEIIMAPSFAPDALELLKSKKNLRLLQVDMEKSSALKKQYVSMNGGMLVQDKDLFTDTVKAEMCVTAVKPTKEQVEDMNFAWRIVKHVKSNAIVVAKNGMTYGVGAGQMNRIGSAKIALEQAEKTLKEEGIDIKEARLVLASDGFFPFDDCVTFAAEYGIKAIVQPGGSLRDEDSINKANEKGISMLMTGKRHFKH